LIDGERVGRTPLGPLPLALGEHQVTFYHPSGAGDRQRVTVTSGATVKVIGNPRR
jgi:PEGA domain